MIKDFSLILDKIEDDYAKENFKRIGDFLLKFPFFRGEWKFFELVFTQAETNKRLPHGLGFKPTDIIETSITDGEAIIYNRSLFDKEYIDVTTTGACTVRCFIGAYKEESGRAGR